MTNTTRHEYKVKMRDARGRRSFTLVNATTEAQAIAIAQGHHTAKTVVSAEPTGRTF